MTRRKLVVSKGKLELAEVFADSPMILIGRSPACDMILRIAGLNPVHFLLEWAGEGDFDPKQGIWVLTELRKPSGKNEKAIAEGSHNKGIVLGAKPVNYGGLTWKWSESRLSGGKITKNRLRKEVRDSAKAISRDLLGPTCLELIRLSPDGESVVDVEYLRRRDLYDSRILREDPMLRIQWRKEGPQVEWIGLDASSLRSGSQSLPGQRKNIDTSDILFFRGKERSYYLRMVPRLSIAESPYEFFADPFVRFTAVCFAVSALLLLMLYKFSPPHSEETIEKRPRIARVEIKEALPPPPPPPPPEPKPEPVPVQPVAEKKPEPPAPTPTPKPVVHKKPKNIATKKKSAPPKVIAPPATPVVTDVSAVGLLGSMKKSKNNNQGVVSADTIVNQNSQAVTGATGKVLTQAAGEIVDMKKTKSVKTGDHDVLSEASSDVDSKSAFNASGVTNVGGRFAGAFSIDANDDGEGGPESGFGESVSGGLSREAVGHAVALARQKIRACFQTALLNNPKLAGHLKVKWMIAPGGSVSSIQKVFSDLNHPSLESCVIGVLRAIKFPENPRGTSTVVVYPFAFKKT